MNYNIPDLKIELMKDTEGGLILLEQDNGGNLDRVAIHQIHLRYMAEKFGLIETSDPLAQKTTATLQRRMLALRHRIDNLTEWMEKFSDHKHADLTYEMTQLHALQDLACEWCHDLDDNATTTATSTSFSTSSLSSEDSENTTELLLFLLPHYPRWIVTSQQSAGLHQTHKVHCCERPSPPMAGGSFKVWRIVFWKPSVPATFINLYF